MRDLSFTGRQCFFFRKIKPACLEIASG